MGGLSFSDGERGLVPSHTLTMDDWLPTTDNQSRMHWARSHKAKQGDAATVMWEAMVQRIPKAVCRRKVDIHFTCLRKGRPPDPTNMLKSLLDALKLAGLLIDDSWKWCESRVVGMDRSDTRKTVIVLTDEDGTQGDVYQSATSVVRKTNVSASKSTKRWRERDARNT